MREKDFDFLMDGQYTLRGFALLWQACYPSEKCFGSAVLEKILIVFGLILTAIGVLLMTMPKFPWLGRLQKNNK